MTTSAPGATASTLLPVARECRTRASLLLKALRGDEPAAALAAAERFRILPAFADLTPERLVASRDAIRRKHALAVIAAELGFASWVALKAALARVPAPRLDWVFDGGGAYLNHWCKTYEEAAASRELSGGYLLAHREHFVVCTADLLSARGLDPHDPDWDRIGRDWVRPRDAEAFARLAARMVDNRTAAPRE